MLYSNSSVTGSQHTHTHTIARLSKNLNPCNYNSSGIGPGNDLVGEVCDFCESDSEEGNDEGEDTLTSLKINSLSLRFFHSQLVTHFSILFERNQIVWPTMSRRSPFSNKSEIYLNILSLTSPSSSSFHNDMQILTSCVFVSILFMIPVIRMSLCA